MILSNSVVAIIATGQIERKKTTAVEYRIRLGPD